MCFLHLGKKTYHLHGFIYASSMFHWCMCLFFHVSIILFWWLWFCSVYWNQVFWCFGFGSFYLRLSWIFRLLNVFFFFLREIILLVVQQGSHWIYRFLWVIQVFTNINSSGLCKWKSFPLSCMFVNFFSYFVISVIAAF